MAEFKPKYMVLHDYGGTPKNSDGMFNPYHTLVFPDGSKRYRYPENPYGQKAPHAHKFNPESVGLSYAGQVGSMPTEAALATLRAEAADIQKRFPGIQQLSHGEAYNQTRGTSRQASRDGRGLDEASWRTKLPSSASDIPAPAPQGGMFASAPKNNEGIVSTASTQPQQPVPVSQRGLTQYAGNASMIKSPPPATPGSGFANVAMYNNIISEAPMPMTAVPGQPTAPMPVVKPAASFASNMPVYGQTSPDKAVSSFNERTGTMMHPTAGREVLHMGGLTPEQQRDTLQGAFDRGNKDMLYVHDNNPRVVARSGDAQWRPTADKRFPGSAEKTGPEFANTFLVSNGYGTNPRPMADSNPLKGSRYDDGTSTGTLPAPPAGSMMASGPSSGPPASATPVQAKSQPAIIAQATPPTEAPPQPPPGPTEPPKSMIAQGPTSGRMALGAGDVQPVQPPPPPSGAPVPSTPPAQPQATGPTPAPQPANVAKPKPPGGMLSAPPKGPQWGWNNGQMGVTWKNGSFTGFGG